MKITLDRKVICNIISEMLDNPDDYGIYGTTEAYDKLEALVQSERMKALGYAHAHCCSMLDKGGHEDPRNEIMPEFIEEALKALNPELL